MFHTNEDIRRIGDGISDCSLPKSDWTHAAHIAAAVWLLDRSGDAAFTIMPDMIRRYNLATGVENTDTDGYHHTITIASLTAIRAAQGEGTLVDRVNRLLAAGYDRPGWLLRHYTREHLFSVKARLGWVDPDLAPLPAG